MAKIYLEKVLIALLDSPFNKQFDDKIKNALKEQGLEYKDGEIVEIRKPKFKVGDWISGYYTNYKVTAINSKGYVVEDTDGNKINILFENEKFHHLFTIADAKNGDVLCDCHEAYDNPLIFILKKFEHVDFGLVRPSDYSSYCYLTAGDIQRFKEGTYHHEHNIKPATKEQRALLFQKMKEAGYEWDTEKKELKKIRKPLYEAGNIIGYKSHYYYIKKVVKGGEIGFYYDLVALDGGKVSSIHSTGEKDIILISNNRFDYEQADIQQKDFAPKATTANRQLYNRAILTILSDYVEKYPDIRFGQMLYNLGVNPHFDEESRETYWNLSKTINKQNHE